MLSLTDKGQLDITPGTNVIHYMRQQNLTWADALKEFIDNAIDQGATRITIEYTAGKGTCIVEDNGNGCRDLKLLVELAARADSQQTRIGQFGVGAKDAQIWAANVVHLASNCGGFRYELRHNWSTVLERQRWELLHPILETTTTDPSGLRIELRDLRHRRPDRVRLSEELGRTYIPWLRAGHALCLKMPREKGFTSIQPFVFPTLLQQQTETFSIEGKSVSVTLGVIPARIHLPWRGVLCLYGSRVITREKRLGIPAEVTSQVSGWAEFARSWGVEKNKRDFTDDLTALEDAIAERFVALFTVAAQQQLARPQDGLKDLLNQRLKNFRLQAGPWRKARRPGPRGVKKGRVMPTGEGTPHQDATEDQPGEGWQRRRFLSMNYANLGVDGPRCQMLDDVITINLDNPCFVQVLSHPQLLESRIISTIAVYLGTEWDNPQQLLPFMDMRGAAERIFTFETLLSGLSLKAPVATHSAAD